ncbi:MAG: Rpn family recombination-promoting nuclease/putative transposase [Gloeobacterales cyanobacterium]
MAKSADIGSKRLISLAPDAWVKWVSQSDDVIPLEILNAEFQWVSRESDVLIKAFSPTYGEFLILNEIQLRYSAKMPLRMRAYAALAEERYGLPTLPILINILPPPATVIIYNRFESNFFGLQVRQDFRVINLWEVEAELVFERSLNTLMPFVPILKGGGEEPVVRRALEVLRQDEQLNQMEPLLAFFASFVMDTELVAQIVRWDMTVLRESPWYQEILQQGEQKGKAEGIAEGRTEGERSLVLRLLARRVGTLPASVAAQVQALELPQLEALGEALLDFAQLSDLTDWLDDNH